ncbi:hypothetical protein cyc_08691 [Cyclospora cayetanensis]|uniref:Uncharacterized protein n=1 Tax=Cyclospora cayetanensis TaxID=88456 RepID=A0A1D3D4J2_9EIME|nr:hypothetical protein cyc_08691 [Cyclospora cayetanensis]
MDLSREGVFLGFDFPLSLNGKWNSWRRRKYNTRSHDSHYLAAQSAKGVNYYPRQHVFAVQWQEDSVHRVRWFRAAYGIRRALRAAQAFRRTLEALGREQGGCLRSTAKVARGKEDATAFWQEGSRVGCLRLQAAFSRVDGEQSERQLRQKAAANRRELRLRKKLFAKISSGQF